MINDMSGSFLTPSSGGSGGISSLNCTLSSYNQHPPPSESKEKAKCPSCDEFKQSIDKTINVNGMTLAVAYNEKFLSMFSAKRLCLDNPASKFFVCSSCNSHCKAALTVALNSFPDAVTHFSKPLNRTKVKDSPVIRFENTSFAIPDVANGTTTTLKSVFEEIKGFSDKSKLHRIIHLENLSHMSKYEVPKFQVGDEVQATRRAGPNERNFGGDCIISSVYYNSEHRLQYDVWYPVGAGRRTESGLSESILTAREVVPSKRRSSRSQTCAGPQSTVEEQLRSELAKEKARADSLSEQLGARDEYNRKQQGKMKVLAQQQSALIKTIKETSDDNSNLKVTIQAQLESFNRQMLDIMNDVASNEEEAISTAKAQGIKEGKGANQKVITQLRKEGKAKDAEMRKTHIEAVRMSATFPQMLAEAASQASTPLQKTLAETNQQNEQLKAQQMADAEAIKQTAAEDAWLKKQVSELEATLSLQMAKLLEYQQANKKENTKHSFSEMAKFFLPSEVYDSFAQKQHLDKIGTRVKSIEKLDHKSKTKKMLGGLVTIMINEVLEASLAGFGSGTSDKSYEELGRVVKGLRASKGTPIGVALSAVESDATKKAMDVEGLAKSYISLRKSGEKRGALSVLSIFASNPAYSDKEVMAMCSELDIKPGDIVTVHMGRNKGMQFRADNVEDTRVFVVPVSEDVIETDDLATKKFWVHRAKVSAHGAVRCTRFQLRRAKLHALKYFPGAKVNATVRVSLRMGSPRAQFVANFLVREDVSTSVEASYVNARKGVKYRLKQNYAATYRRLYLEMILNNLKPVSWGYFYNKTHTGEYDLETADNCCCSHCRDLGYYNFEELNDILNELNVSLKCLSSQYEQDVFNTSELKKVREKEFDNVNRQLLARVKSQKDFLSGAYQTHLKATDGNAWHCLQCLLTTSNNPEFCKPCTHERSDGKVVPPQETMDEMYVASEKAASRSGRTSSKSAPRDFWNGECQFCDVSNNQQLLLCYHCNVVAHKKCAQALCNDIPLRGTDQKWICVECTSVNDSVHHTTTCEECNEFGYIISDVQLLLNVLNGFEEQMVKEFEKQKEIFPPEKLLSPILRARLDTVEQKQDQYRAHKIRHFNQDGFKELCLKNMELNQCYMLVDYWAKLKSQDASTATCEGEEVGISTHGSMFVYKNPTLEDRKKISVEHPAVDWSKFAPAPEEGGDEFLIDFFNEFCDNSKQTAFHTASTLDAAITLFGLSRPWLVVDRNMFLQSDGAVNYRDPTTELDVLVVYCRCITESGEGKDRIDSNCAIIKRLLRQARNKARNKKHQRNAKDYVRDANDKIVAGNVNFEVLVDAALEEKAAEELKRKPVEGISGLYLWKVNDTVEPHTITFWEALDREASDCSPFNPVGYGPGRIVTVDYFNKHHRTRSSQMGATLVEPDTIEMNTTQLKSREEKKEAKVRKEAISEAKKAKTVLVKEELDMKKQSQDRQEVYECSHCNIMYCKEAALEKHLKDGDCERKAEEQKIKRAAQDVKVLVSQHNQQQVNERDQAIKNMTTVEVSLSAVTNRKCIGIELALNASKEVVVSSVDPTGLAFFSMKVDVGFVLLQIEVEDNVTDVGACDDPSTLLPPLLEKPMKLKFRRDEAPLPMHGFARKNIQTVKNFTYHERQKEWLENYWAKHMTHGVRAQKMCDDMKADFGNELREDINAPFWLDRTRLRGWISSSKQAAKDKKKFDSKLLELDKKKLKEVLAEQAENTSAHKRSSSSTTVKSSKSSKTNEGGRGKGGGRGGGGGSRNKKREAEPAVLLDEIDSDESSVCSDSDDFGDSSDDE